MAELRRSLGLWDVVLLNVVAVVSLRWLPVAAQTGASSISLWLLALLLFFLPSGLAVLELGTRFPEEGGIYIWVKRTLGDSHGFLCAWCYWVNNLFYFPSLLIATAAVAPYLGGERLSAWSESKPYVAVFTLALLWLAVWVGVRGLQLGRWFQNVGAVSNWVPVLILVLLGAAALARFGSATGFSGPALLPPVLRHGVAGAERLGNLNFWATMCFAFAGMELSSTMSGEIRDPRRTLPRAILAAGALIALVYIAGTCALLLALPPAELSLVGGIPQAASRLGGRFGLPGLGALITVFLVVANLGCLMAWFAGAARVLFVAGLDRALPPALGRLHPRHQTPHVTLLVQGVLSTLILLMSALGKGTTVGNLYLLLVDMTLVIYFIPFLYLFLSLLVLRLRAPLAAEAGVIPVPGGRTGALLCGLLGFSATLLAIALATLPPEDVAQKEPVQLLGLTMSAAALFRAKVIGGCAAFVLLGVLLRRAGAARAQSLAT